MKNLKIKYIGYIITVLSFVYLFNIIINLETNIFSLKTPVLGFFLILLFSFYYAILLSITTLGWKFVLDFLSSKKVSYKRAFQINAKSNIAKYLPGNIFHFVGRNYLGKRIGLKHSDIVLGSFFELIFLIATASVISVITLFQEFMDLMTKFSSALDIKIYILIFAVLLIFGVVYLRIKEERRKFLHQLKMYEKKKFILLFGKNFLINTFSFITQGFILFLIFKFILKVNVSYSQLPLIISAFTFSWLAGYITPGSPAGIGVRESFLLLMLSHTFGREPTLTAALISRLTSMIGDVFAFIIGMLVGYFKSKNLECKK